MTAGPFGGPGATPQRSVSTNYRVYAVKHLSKSDVVEECGVYTALTSWDAIEVAKTAYAQKLKLRRAGHGGWAPSKWQFHAEKIKGDR